MYFLQGRYYSGSEVYTSGSTLDVVTGIKSQMGLTGSPIVIKKLEITSPAPNAVKFNGYSYWSDLLLDSTGSYCFRTTPGEIYVSSMYFLKASASQLRISMIFTTANS